MLKVWYLGNIGMLHIGDTQTGQSVRIGTINRIFSIVGRENCQCVLSISDGREIALKEDYRLVMDAIGGQ